MTSFLPEARTRRVVSLTVAIGAFVVGIAVGRLAAYYQTASPGFGGGAVMLFLLASGLCVFGLVALVTARLIGATDATARSVFILAVASSAGGAILGAATAAATGGTYRQPVVLEAPGSVTFELTEAEPVFDPRPATATCISGPDVETASYVEMSDLGALGGGTLSATVSLDIGEERRHDVSLEVGGVTLADRARPTWVGPVEIVELSSDRTSGRIRFTNLPIEDLKGVPAPAPPWNAPISGTLAWACEPLVGGSR
jgi:hypothetical protein